MVCNSGKESKVKIPANLLAEDVGQYHNFLLRCRGFAELKSGRGDFICKITFNFFKESLSVVSNGL